MSPHNTWQGVRAHINVCMRKHASYCVVQSVPWPETTNLQHINKTYLKWFRCMYFKELAKSRKMINDFILYNNISGMPTHVVSH